MGKNMLFNRLNGKCQSMKYRLPALLFAVCTVCLTGITIAAADPDGKGGDLSARIDSDTLDDAASKSPDEMQDIVLDELVVTASRTPKSPHEEPATIDVISRKDLDDRMIRTVPDALKYTPGIMIQKTAYGQGSPYIRGFTSFHNLFLVDGIRLNNTAFRPGPNQYWNTIDPFTISQMEVVKGPSSVLFGSDAIGGTVNVRTPSPFDLTDGPIGGRMYYRHSTGEDSHVGRLEGYGVLPKSKDGQLGYMVGVTGKDFGDIKGGRDVGMQRRTGYEEYDFDLKLEHYFDPDTWLTTYFQQARQNNVPRTHKTIYGTDWENLSVGSDLRHELDQERDLAYLQFHKVNMDGFIDTSHFGVSWHSQEEVCDRIKGNGSREFQGFDVGQLGLTAQLESDSPVGDWVYGAEWYHDFVDSFSSRNPIQGPIADDASYDMAGVYIQDTISSWDEKLDLILGSRYTYVGADADEVRDPVSGDQITVKDHWDSVVGSARLLWHVDDHDRLRLFTGVSQGFRAPNLSDLTRFDSARSNEFEIPSTNLDSEEYTTYEVGSKYKTDNVVGQLTYFYTDIRNQIMRYPTGNVNGDGEFEITKGNIGDGYVHGVEMDAHWKFHPQFTLFTSCTWMDGEVSTYPTSAQILTDEPLDRIMPLTGLAGLRWDHPDIDFWIEGLVQTARRQDDLSTSDRSDTSRIPPGGTPGYSVLSFYSGWQITRQTAVTLAIENVTDEDYRIHGSGSNEVGLNLLLGLEHKF